MFKHSPSRNQRSKGFKIKHALQIALLLAVCIWLIYQVKHSHDKKKAFEENAAKLSEKIESQHDIIKFGRKDLNPRVEKTASENERHGEEEETQEEEEEEEIKHEEEEETKHEEEEEEIKHDEEEEQEEEENKPEEIENEGRGDGDDEIDEHEQQRTGEEAKREEDFVDEEERDKHDNENEENEMEVMQRNESEEETKASEEKVNEEENKESAENEEETKANEEDTKESEEKENEKETKERENQVEEQDHDRNTQEAREEQYKGDDASSAVVRDTQAVSTEGESGVIGNSNEKEHVENLQANELGMENKTSNLDEVTSEQKDSDLKAGHGETTEGNSIVTATDGSNSAVNATEIQEKGSEINLSKLEDGSVPILTTKESIDLQEVNNSSTAENVGTPSASLLNGTDKPVETTSSDGGDLDHKPVLLDQTENSNMTAEMLRSDSNSSLSTKTQNEDASKKESEESSSNSGTVVQEEQNAREEGSSKSSITSENEDEDQNENSETTTEEEDNSSSSTTNDNVDLIDNNSTEDSLFHELKEGQTDLGTLPEIETEGNNSEDVAAER